VVRGRVVGSISITVYLILDLLKQSLLTKSSVMLRDKRARAGDQGIPFVMVFISFQVDRLSRSVFILFIIRAFLLLCLVKSVMVLGV